MGQTFAQLTNPAVVSPTGQAQFYPSQGAAGIALARQAASTAQPSIADVGNQITPNTPNSGPSFNQPEQRAWPQAATSNLDGLLPGSGNISFSDNQSAQPRMIKPSYQQAVSTGPAGMPNAMSPGLSKLGKLLTMLTSAGQGALGGLAAQEQAIIASGGRRAGGVGTGFQGGYNLPFLRAMQGNQVQQGALENQMLGAQARLYPQIAMLGAQKTGSEIQRNIAEGQKASAEAGAIPTKQALEQAQALAAQWKEEPATGLLRNLSTGETMNPGDGGMAILDPGSAAVLGKNPGDKVPLKLALQAKQFVDAGVKTVQAGGRSLLVDSSGKTIKDLGASTPVVVNQLGFSQFGQKEGIKSAGDQYNTAMGADERLDRMESSYQKALGGDQQAMLSLLTDHIGMTLGLQKGARITKDILTEAQQSQPWLEGLKAKFDGRGYLSGATLGPDQMRQMLDLGYEARNRAWQTAFNTSQLYGVQEPPNARTVFNKRNPNSRIYQQSSSGNTRPPLASFEHP